MPKTGSRLQLDHREVHCTDHTEASNSIVDNDSSFPLWV